ncbi:YadA-like family protein, partial [Phyllobacterium lublinensis]|uniref:YadA-like family protein n=1 Tax=Phyllobacterium lublinensis TaxID=2875708 RepID=UPI001CCAEF7B
ITNIDDRVTINEGDINKINTSINNINSGAAGLVQQSAAGESITIAKDLDGAAIDIGGTFAGKKGPRKLINVDRGVDDTDAVNFGQLRELSTAGSDAVKRLGDAAVKYAWDDKNSNGALDADEVVDPNRVRLAGTNGTVISNVGKGLVDQTSTEAVNGSQLFGVSRSVATILGGKAGVDADGNVTQPTYRIQTRDVHTVEDALTSLDGQVTVNTTNIASNTNAINGLKQDALQWDPIAAVFSARHGTDTTSRISNVKAGTEDTDAVNVGQLKGLQTAGTDAVKRLGDRSAKYAWIDTNSSKAFDEGDQVDLTRLELEGPVGTGTVINNVGRGEVSLNSMQAINGAQLWYTSNSFATYLGGDASINAGILTAPKYDIAVINKDGTTGATNTFNNVGDALRLLNTNITYVNSRVVDSDALRWDPTKQSFTALRGGGTTTDTTTGGGSAPVTKTTEVGAPLPVAVDNRPGERKITDLQAGNVSVTSTDAVNGSQLHATNTAVNTLDDVAVKYAAVDGSKTNQVALSGADPNAPVLISNVDAGKNDTDAVNLRQLKDTVQEAVITNTNTQYNQYLDQSKSYTNNYADQKAATTLADAKAYTDERFNQLSSDIGSVRSEARQAAAIGLAAASLRFDGAPGKISVAMGGGAWRGQGAVAYGAGYTSESGKVRANISGVHSGGEFGIGAGISFTLN